MINTNKFLSRSSTSTLSTRSILDLGIIRSDSKKIDNLLKERLVLSKVRYGIERQRLERERRRNRETSLENDAEQNYEISDFSKDNSKRRDGKPKRGLGFFMGTVLRTVVSSIGGLAFAAIPRFNLINDKVIKSGTNFNRTIGGTDGLLNSIKSQKGPFDTLKKVKLDPVRNIGKTITGFGNSLQFFVTSAIAGQVGGRAIDRFRTPAQAKAQVEAQVAQSAKRQKIRSKVIARETVIVKETAKKAEVRNLFKPITRYKTIKDITGSESFKRKAKNIRKRKSKTPKGEKVTADKIKKEAQKEAGGGAGSGRNIKKIRLTEEQKIVNAAFSKDPYQRLARIAALERELGIKFKPQVKANLKTMSPQNFLRFYSDYYDISEGFGPPEAPFTKKNRNQNVFDEMFDNVRTGKGGMDIEDPFKGSYIDPPPRSGPFSEINTPEARAKRFKQSFGKPTGANPFTGKGTYQVTPTITSFDPETGVTTVTLTKGREFDPITGEIKAKKRTVKASKVTGKKGLGKFMANIGGAQFLKPIRKFLGEAIGAIPFVGDLVAFLLDIFVFGEPPGRAAFMAIGSILGAFLGGLAGSIGGPPGVFLGGLIGGIGGDLLGGALYNLLFGGGQAGFGERAPKSILKSSVKAGLYTGGEATFGKYLLGEKGPEYVIDSDSYRGIEEEAPGFLAALNDADAGEVPEVLRSYASYEGTAGRERLVPVPIPQKEEVGSQQIMIMESTSTIASSPFSQHYRRG